MYDFIQPHAALGSQAAPSILPRMDVLETADRIVYLFEIPGIDPAQLNLEASRSELVVSAPLASHAGYGEISSLYLERASGNYYRMVVPPGNVNADSIEANYKNGILEVAIPKTGRRQTAAAAPSARQSTASGSQTARSNPGTGAQKGRQSGTTGPKSNKPNAGGQS